MYRKDMGNKTVIHKEWCITKTYNNKTVICTELCMTKTYLYLDSHLY